MQSVVKKRFGLAGNDFKFELSVQSVAKKKFCALFEYFLQSFEFFYFAITKVFYSALGAFWRYGRKILCIFTVKSLHIVCGLRNYYYLCTRKTNRGVEQW